MSFNNYLTTYKTQLMVHVKRVYVPGFTNTLALSGAELKQTTAKMLSGTALPIHPETYQWITSIVRYIVDRDNVYVYNNTTGLWQYERDSITIRNILGDLFTAIHEQAYTSMDTRYQAYADAFLTQPQRIDRLAKMLVSSAPFRLEKSAEIVTLTEPYRYANTVDGRRALIDMTKDRFNMKVVTFKDTQPLLLNQLAPMPIDVVDNPPTLWLSLLETYMMHDPEMIAYLHKVLAYMMSPYNYNQVFIMFLGDGRNGKSTLIKVLQDILGGLAVRLSSDLLDASPPPSFKRDDAIASTEGKSLLIFNEVDERIIASTRNIKDLTEGGRDEYGNKIMTMVRPAYSKSYEVCVSGTPVVITNTRLNFGDWAALDPIFKRLIMIPFDYRITVEDPTLLSKLAQEYPQIQAWLYKNYFAHKGILIKDEPKPARVAEVVNNYVADSDIIHSFWGDCVEVTHSGNDSILRSDLYRMYETYCRVNGRKPIANKGPNGFAKLVIKQYKDIPQVSVSMTSGREYIRGVKQSQYYVEDVSQTTFGK